MLRHPSSLLRAAIHGAVPEATPVYPDIEPVVGALLLAADSVGARPDRDRIRDALDWTAGAGLMGGIRLEQTTKVYPNGVKAIDDVYARHPTTVSSWCSSAPPGAASRRCCA